MANRDGEFSEKTKKIVAARAGYRCSFPGCDEATIGPGANPDDVENKGVAAHIFSASPSGPRGTGGLSAEQRQAAMNGIWLCEDHGKIVDTENGKNYLASALQVWKSYQEQRISDELKKTPTINTEWLTSIEIGKNPIFRRQSVINLGKVTILIGPNGSGKTALCEWLAASMGRISALERWGGINNNTANPIEFILKLDALNKHEAKISFKKDQFVCLYDMAPVKDLSQVFQIVYLDDDARMYQQVDDIHRLANVWGIHPYQVRGVLREITKSKYGYITEVKIKKSGRGTIRYSTGVNKNTNTNIYVKIGDHKDFIPLNLISGRETSQLLVSGAIVLANRASRNGPTMLIVDLGGQLLPDGLLSIYAKLVANPEFKFQTLFVSPDDQPKVDWSGWSVIHLTGKPPATIVEQEHIKM